MVNMVELGEVASKRGCIWEFLFAFAVSLPFFTQGLAMASHEPYKRVFITEDITLDETAMLVAAAASAPVFAFIANKFGRKPGYFCISLVQGATLIPLYISTSTTHIYFNILSGISAAGVYTILPPYIREITPLMLRSFSLISTMVLTLAGYLTRMADDRYGIRMFSLPAFIAVQLMLMLYVVESPGYLMMAGKDERAKTALSSLKRLPEDDPLILKEINDLNVELTKAGKDGKNTFIKLYRNKIIWDSLKMGVLLFTTMELCGSLVFLNNDPYHNLAGMMNLNVVIELVLVGSVLSLVAGVFWDMKYLLTISYGVMAVSLGVYAVQSQFQFGHGSVREALGMAVDSFLLVLLVAYGMAWQLMGLVTVDLFNVQIRTPVLAALFTYSQLLKLLHAHTFQYLRDYVGIHTLFYVFAGVNLYGGVYSLFVLPKTRNKELKQIEKQVKRIPLPA